LSFLNETGRPTLVGTLGCNTIYFRKQKFAYVRVILNLISLLSMFQ
jgi:hypothetical protein